MGLVEVVDKGSVLKEQSGALSTSYNGFNMQTLYRGGAEVGHAKVFCCASSKFGASGLNSLDVGSIKTEGMDSGKMMGDVRWKNCLRALVVDTVNCSEISVE